MAERPGSSPSPLARPGVLSLNIREKAALYAAYMPFLKGGGIFIPSNRAHSLGEEVLILLSLLAAVLAPLQVPLDLLRLPRVQGPEHVGGEVVAPAAVISGRHTSPSASSPRIFSNPSRILPFTVPIGKPRMRAISEWLKPPK